MKLRFRIKNWLEGAWLEIERVYLNILIKILPQGSENPDECEHEWLVESVDYDTVALELTCYRCLSNGVVDDPTSTEWDEAYGASMKPYEWDDHSRVTYIQCFAD